MPFCLALFENSAVGFSALGSFSVQQQESVVAHIQPLVCGTVQLLVLSVEPSLAAVRTLFIVSFSGEFPSFPVTILDVRGLNQISRDSCCGNRCTELRKLVAQGGRPAIHGAQSSKSSQSAHQPQQQPQQQLA
ncbi:protein misato1 [Dorcoceras hygrometricum]|uniref:Protein misato1 n=1 Tax=Dorcoceras hygrometricum TaxID=472368 RepID=A0A2Z7AFY9_9LAMI|nr:protein misato1 [Dorcoceras hygrometricum]